MKLEKKRVIVTGIAAAALALLFILTKSISPEYIKDLGLTIPLPLFTVIIGFLDGFNPCTIWLLTFLLVLLISVSQSRKRIFAVGYTFVVVVFAIYFFFMALWLNVFLFLGYVDILRYIIAAVALIAGAVNCKDYFLARKNICVGGVCDIETPEEQSFVKRIIFKRLNKLMDVVKKGSMPALLLTSVILAVFSSVVEIPCTFGFPLIFTKILAEKVFENSLGYYSYIFLYNIIYVIPLVAIITFFGYTFKGKEISKEKMQLIKFIGGLVMLALGIVLLINPELLILH